MKTNAKTLDLKFQNQESSENENTQMWHEIIQQGLKLERDQFATCVYAC